MSDAPDFIWATEDKANFGEDRFHSTRECSGLTPYVRRDPAVLAALPEVQAMVAAAVMEAADAAKEAEHRLETEAQQADQEGHDTCADMDREASRACSQLYVTILALIKPDARAALDAHVAAEVRKAEHLAYIRGLENSLAMVRSMRASDGLLRGQELICSGLEINLTKARALIPEVKP